MKNRLERLLAGMLCTVLLLCFGCQQAEEAPQAEPYDYPDWASEAEAMCGRLHEMADREYALKAEPYWYPSADGQSVPRTEALDGAVKRVLSSAQVSRWSCGDSFTPGAYPAELAFSAGDGSETVSLGLGQGQLSWKRTVFDVCFEVLFTVDGDASEVLLASLGERSE